MLYSLLVLSMERTQEPLSQFPMAYFPRPAPFSGEMHSYFPQSFPCRSMSQWRLLLKILYNNDWVIRSQHSINISYHSEDSSILSFFFLFSPSGTWSPSLLPTRHLIKQTPSPNPSRTILVHCHPSPCATIRPITKIMLKEKMLPHQIILL